MGGSIASGCDFVNLLKGAMAEESGGSVEEKQRSSDAVVSGWGLDMV